MLNVFMFILAGMFIVVGLWAAADFFMSRFLPTKGLIRLEIFIFDKSTVDAELTLMGARKRAHRHKTKLCRTIVVDKGMSDEVQKICRLIGNDDGLFVFCNEAELSCTIENIVDLQI